jgi:hypothetical protein
MHQLATEARMSTRHPQNPCLALRASNASVEWEELPSLPGVLLRRHVPQASYAIASELVQQAQSRLRSAPSVAPVWIETMPAIFDPLLPSAPLADTHINGLASREIMEPDVFKHFFGAGVAR